MWEPQPGAQTAAYTARWVDDLFLGGDRGGGKTSFQCGYQEDAALRYDGKSRGIMFRQTLPELEEVQFEAMKIFGASGAVYKTHPSERYPFSNCWYWPNGATCKMRYNESVKDYVRYHGHQYTTISFDEATQYPDLSPILMMISTLRSPHGVPCTIRLTGNPGGPGHAAIKARYVAGKQPLIPWRELGTGRWMMWVRSEYKQNRILADQNPNYRGNILAATQGNKALERAWLDGDWDIIAGAFFEVWDERRHVVQPFEIPAHWFRFRSGDWGSARPFSFGWWAVVSDDYHVGNGLILPRGCLVRYREYYGAARSQTGDTMPNSGVKLPAEEVGAALRDKEQGDPPINPGVLDPACFSSDGGPSIAERLMRGSGAKVIWRAADNTRIGQRGAMGGWDQMRQRLIGEDIERPMIVCFQNCRDSIRTIPCMQHDPDRLEDVNSDLEDHAADEWRYACMSRPYTREAPGAKIAKFPTQQTISELIKAHGRARREQ
jgi:hypothetical protein